MGSKSVVSWSLLWLLLCTASILLQTAEALRMQNKKDFKKCGGAKACLGTSKLERVRRKNGMHKNADELANLFDTDEDLVRALKELNGLLHSPLLILHMAPQFPSRCPNPPSPLPAAPSSSCPLCLSLLHPSLQNLDADTDVLIYTCAGMLPSAAAAAASSTSAEAVGAAESTQEAAIHSHSHHTHDHVAHGRHLSALRPAYGEIATGWQVSKRVVVVVVMRG